jgi:glyoxylase-like metal-dependent hydrolase (beta-lactamase superfamily II)
MPRLTAALCIGMAAWLAPTWIHARVVPPFQELAPGVYAVVGENAEASVGNHGAVGNQGVLIGQDGVILIDTGTSAQYAVELLESVRELTSEPVVLAINTHADPAFIFGNGTLISQGVPVLAHRRAAQLIQQRCMQCLKNLVQILGDETMRGTAVTVPTQTIDDSVSITVAGRVLDILYFEHSSSEGSIGVLDRASGTLFAGGLVSFGRVPDTTEGQIDVWMTALHALKERRPTFVVPGEGPVGSTDDMEHMERYLMALRRKVEQTYERGISLSEAAAHSQLPEFERWPLYSSAHNRNVQQLYLDMERATLERL